MPCRGIIVAEIEYEGKRYRFSTWSLVLFPIGTVLGSLFLYYGTEFWFGYWIHWAVANQTAWVLNLFGVHVQVQYFATTLSGEPVWWEFVGDIPTPILFTHECSGFQAIAIFAALILFTPHSQDPDANKGIWRRKLIALAISSLLFHGVNVLRMVIQLSLYHAGLPWDSIHYSISAASSIIAAIIILLMHRWIPEFVISIMITGNQLKQGVLKRMGRIEVATDQIESDSEASSPVPSGSNGDISEALDTG